MSQIGRNESCPCGSGKKYKKCCLPSIYDQIQKQRVAELDLIERKTNVRQGKWKTTDTHKQA